MITDICSLTKLNGEIFAVLLKESLFFTFLLRWKFFQNSCEGTEPSCLASFYPQDFCHSRSCKFVNGMWLLVWGNHSGLFFHCYAISVLIALSKFSKHCCSLEARRDYKLLKVFFIWLFWKDWSTPSNRRHSSFHCSLFLWGQNCGTLSCTFFLTHTFYTRRLNLFGLCCKSLCLKYTKTSLNTVKFRTMDRRNHREEYF